ncbi:hypothetical protein NQ315_016548 [Exocentrus adspersus]|uniref:C2H2-type domain-containing protein n=1 Tax=Exocentrus adspersus TaxID=1586481 RepID=A0AAV8VYR4_9CUCU|nr:hypothetical protein NQ315_016548 [Exocentrus adspersus]
MMDTNDTIIDSSATNKKHKCPEEGCDVSFSRPFKLEIHRRKHSGERPFLCDVEGCTKAFTKKNHLQRHKCFVHEKSQEVCCTVSGCGLVYNNKYSLRKHISQHHAAGGMYKCAHCLQEFKKKRQLKRHLYSHAGPDILKCSLCNVSFDSLHRYNRHKSNHKTYTCDCGTVFERWTQFCEHRRNSCNYKTDHKCVICNKIFTTKSNLKDHSLLHLDESQRDMYRCPYMDCKRNYKYKKNLNSHIKLAHENNEPKYKCTEEGCNSLFRFKSNLNNHVLCIHKSLPKERRDRKPRKDKGNRKKCMASIMSGVPLPVKEHLTIIEGSISTINIAVGTSPKEVLQEETVVRDGIDENKLDKITLPATSKESNNPIVNENSSPFDIEYLMSIEEKLKQKFVTSLTNFKTGVHNSAKKLGNLDSLISKEKPVSLS